MRRARALMLLGLAAAAARCGSSTPAPRAIASKVIGQAGGRISSASGNLEVQVPAGALMSNVALTIQQIDPPAAGAVGQTF